MSAVEDYGSAHTIYASSQ